MTNSKELKIAAISDIHLGSRRNKTSDIIAALDAAFPDNEETGQLDLLVLVGDVFDRLLNLPDDDTSEIEMWIGRLLYICSKRNIILRILEGTPSHDWKQSASFEKVLNHKGYSINCKYVSILSIEYIEQLDIQVLYIPDEWQPTTDKTLKEVKDLLALKNLEQVDFAFMHGQFEFQLPSHIKGMPRHSSQEYLKLVKHYIFIGHIHVFSTFDRIIAQGSFDRLSHGEEAPKGHVRATVSKDNKEFFFIENKKARIYKTIECKDFDLQKTFASIKKKLEKFPDGSCIRITANNSHPILGNMDQLIVMYPTLVWTKLAKNVEKQEVQEDENIEHQAITITKENVVSLVMARIKLNISELATVTRTEHLLLETISERK